MLSNELIRFKNDAIFEEAEPPAERSRPLEWRRSFNTIQIPASDGKLEYAYTVNNIDFFMGLGEQAQQPSDAPELPRVSPIGERHIRVRFLVDQSVIRDRIFFTEEVDKKAGTFKLRGTKEPITLVLTDAKPGEQRGPFAAGAFAGYAYRNDHEPGQDGIVVEVTVPTAQLEEVAASVNSGRRVAVQAAVALRVFSFEVDDALREWYDPQDLFIHGHGTPAALSSLVVSYLDAGSAASDAQVADDSQSLESAPVPLPQAQLSSPSYAPLLKGIKTALWALVVLQLLHLIKS